jgi:hypothetical protein
MWTSQCSASSRGLLYEDRDEASGHKFCEMARSLGYRLGEPHVF